MIGQLLLALAILISLHELGHFLAARMFGIKVEKFYLFFDAWGFKLFKFKKGDTEYGIGWLPLGGYVKIAGMVDESLDKEQMNQEPQPWEFRSKPAWQRMIVMVGGVFVNLVLGVFIYSLGLFYYGEKYLDQKTINDNGGIQATELGMKLGFQTGDQILLVNNENIKRPEAFLEKAMLNDNVSVLIHRNFKDTTILLPSNTADLMTEGKKNMPFVARFKNIVENIEPGSVAEKAGLEKGDELLTINGSFAVYYDQLSSILEEKPDSIQIGVLRNGQIQNLSIVKSDTSYKLGIQLADTYTDKLQIREYGFIESFSVGSVKSFSLLVANAEGLWRVVSGKIKAQNALQGPIAIAGIFGKVWDWQNFWNLTAVLSLVLAFMNLLPIPALDGGHLLFLTIEVIIGRPLSDKVLHIAQVIGMVLILALMVFVLGNDIFRLFK